MPKTAWHSYAIVDVLKTLGTTEQGLSSAEAEKRRATYGANILTHAPVESAFAVFLRQFKSPLIAILIVAALLSFVLKEVLDALLILAILIFNATIGFFQERRADAALRALEQLIPANAVVLRDGVAKTITQEDIVPGDVLLLETGDIIPCDGRIFSLANLKVQEAILTGEATPVVKQTRKLPDKTALPDRLNMVYRGTTVSYGRGRAIVTATGMQTRYGSILQSMQQSEHEPAPIQRRFTQLSRSIGIAVIGVALIVVALGVLQDLPLLSMLLVGLALAVSVIPEGLPIVVTVTLAIGMWRMARRKAIVRKLPAVETLGSVNLIASDKTGTLTFGEMMVQRAFVSSTVYTVSGKGYRTTGAFSVHGQPVQKRERDLILALRIGVLCNNASLRVSGRSGGASEVIGDPTEIALLVAGAKLGVHAEGEEKSLPRIGEIPFDSDKKYMMTIHQDDGREFVAVKGAPEKILAMSNRIRENGNVKLLTKSKRDILNAEYTEMARASLRGMAMAYLESHQGMRDASGVPKKRNLIFVGLFGIRDAVREEAAATISVAARAGIRTIMVTGDHRDTAVAIARELNILPDVLPKGDEDLAVIEGHAIDELSDQQLRDRFPALRVAARVSPEHKLRLVQTGKRLGSVVAVTGDGVNDAPALVESDIGIAVDAKSTDAAKAASDIVLTDGNFSTIIAAVEEGRTIFSNIRRVTLYLLSTNTVEAVLILITLIGGMPLPLLPIQILWLNVVTDTFLDVSIGTEPKHASIMQDGPNPKKEPIINRYTLGRLLFLTSIMIGIVFIIYRISLSQTLDLRYVYAMTLTSLAVSQWFNSFNVRSGRQSLFKVGLFRNRFHLAALGLVTTLQLLALYFPPLTNALHLAPLTSRDWLLIVGLGCTVFILEEIRKFFTRHWRSRAKDVHTPAVGYSTH